MILMDVQVGDQIVFDVQIILLQSKKRASTLLVADDEGTLKELPPWTRNILGFRQDYAVWTAEVCEVKAVVSK